MNSEEKKLFFEETKELVAEVDEVVKKQYFLMSDVFEQGSIVDEELLQNYELSIAENLLDKVKAHRGIYNASKKALIKINTKKLDSLDKRVSNSQSKVLDVYRELGMSNSYIPDSVEVSEQSISTSKEYDNSDNSESRNSMEEYKSHLSEKNQAVMSVLENHQSEISGIQNKISDCDLVFDKEFVANSVASFKAYSQPDESLLIELLHDLPGEGINRSMRILEKTQEYISETKRVTDSYQFVNQNANELYKEVGAIGMISSQRS
mgnify:CR=1 FL=1